MCGIAAIIGALSERESSRIRRYLEPIVHRGSSLFEIAVLPGAALGANRLPITDRTRGIQPLSNESGSIVAVHNGEIFNHRTLRARLERRGHTFSTECDTEVLLHGYEEYGDRLVDFLDSEMFAFVLFDSMKADYLAVRDRLGVKPLYYALDREGRIHFASELKQFCGHDDLVEVNEFPPAHMMTKSGMRRYWSPPSPRTGGNEDILERRLSHLLLKSVNTRVQTDLPIAVLLSGGVDSSLIMELATRFHSRVKAFILGKVSSPDFEAATNLCRRFRYEHQVVLPDEDLCNRIDDAIYYMETFDAQVVRQSFALDTVCREIARQGYRIALAGDGADELFCGYNEFALLRGDEVQRGSRALLSDLSHGHNQRLDRMSMKHTLEIRAPFFDRRIVDFALALPEHMKVRRSGHRVETKYLLRRVASRFLPHDIAFRYKAPFSNGAGMNVGFNVASGDGCIAAALRNARNEPDNQDEAGSEASVYDEEAVFCRRYEKLGYTIKPGGRRPLCTKDTLRSYAGVPNNRVLVAEFAKLPLYYPLYHAASGGFFSRHGLSVDFVASGSDWQAFRSLVENTAHIGIADPVYSYTQGHLPIGGRIIGQLVGKNPLKLMTFSPDRFRELPLRERRIGTLNRLTTSHTLASFLFPESQIVGYEPHDLLDALRDREVDAALLIPEIAVEASFRGAVVLPGYSDKLEEFLFTGITIADSLHPEMERIVDPFMAALSEAVRHIRRRRSNALEMFRSTFPNIPNRGELFRELINLWSPSLKINDRALGKARHVWRKVHPWLLKSSSPRLRVEGAEGQVVSILTSKRFSRALPYREDQLRRKIEVAIRTESPIELFGFWGASSKSTIAAEDSAALDRLVALRSEIEKSHRSGVHIQLLLSDVHAVMNRFPSDCIRRYLEMVRAECEARGIETRWLGELWSDWGLTRSSVLIETSRLGSVPDNWRNNPLRGSLERAAGRIFSPDLAVFEAQRYFAMRMLERSHLERTFQNRIFFTYSDDETQEILPDMSTIYLWVDSGTSRVPWFVSDSQPLVANVG